MWHSHTHTCTHLTEHKLIHTQNDPPSHVFTQGSIFLSNQISIFQLSTSQDICAPCGYSYSSDLLFFQPKKFGHSIQGAFLSLFEVNELMDLIQGDWLSVNSTPPQVYLLCSHWGQCSLSECPVRFCFGEQDGEALMCVLILSACLPDCLPFLPSFMHIYWEHCLWCLAALSIE